MADPIESMRRQLDAIWERSRREIEGRVETIESAAVDLLSGKLECADRATAMREAHKLAGVAGTFGFPVATTLAREAEGILRPGRTITPAEVVRLAAIANALRVDLIEKGRGSAGSSAAKPEVTDPQTGRGGR